MKLEIGKEYMTRDGFKVKVYDITNNENYPVIAGVTKNNIVTPTSYTIDGVYVCGRSSSYDIIGEWQEPLDFDWSCLPAWANKYIAMDSDGAWFAFSNKPEKSTMRFIWENTGKSCEAILIPKDYIPKNFKGTWENSLFKNPTHARNNQ